MAENKKGQRSRTRASISLEPSWSSNAVSSASSLRLTQKQTAFMRSSIETRFISCAAPEPEVTANLSFSFIFIPVMPSIRHLIVLTRPTAQLTPRLGFRARHRQIRGTVIAQSTRSLRIAVRSSGRHTHALVDTELSGMQESAFTISAAVGFIAVAGVAALSGDWAGLGLEKPSAL